MDVKCINPKTRHDLLITFSVTRGNPNGDPDAGGAPRETQDGYGIVTGESIKRLVRDAAEEVFEQKIYIRSGPPLEEALLKAVERAYNGDSSEAPRDKKGNLLVAQVPKDKIQAILDELRSYFDNRMFGAVFASQKVPVGRFRGPVAIGDARSFDEIVVRENRLTRVVSAKSDEGKDRTGQGTFAERYAVDFGFYESFGSFSPHGSGKHVSEEDLKVLFQSLVTGFQESASARRGGSYQVHRIYVFTHDNALGNASQHDLRKVVKVTKRKDVDSPLSLDDYLVEVNRGAIPKGVHLSIIDNSNVLDPQAWYVDSSRPR